MSLLNYRFDKTKVQSKEDITLHICNMIIMDLQPISIVDDEGFRKLIQFCFPAYTMPSRDTITRRIEKIFEVQEKELIRELEKAIHVAITTDGWTSDQTKRTFTTYTVAYIELQTGKYKNKVLRTSRFKKAHTRVNIYNDLDKVTKEFKILGTL